MTLPHREGYGRPDKQEGAATPQGQAASAERYRLTDLATDYELFSHGLFFSRGQLAHDPLAQLPGAKLKLLVLRSASGVFRGMGSFDHLLFGCPKERWQEVHDALAFIGGVDRAKNYYWRAMAQRLPLLDFVAAKSLYTGPVPFVCVTVFGVDSNKGIWACAPAQEVAADHRIPVLCYPPVEETLRLGRAVLGGQARPFDAIDPLRAPR